MPDLLTAYAQAQPDKLAVIDDRLGVDVRTVTYAEFEAVTNRLAHVLRDHGVGPGRRRSCGAARTRWASPTSSSPPARSGPPPCR